MTFLKIFALYVLATLIFPYSWLLQQRDAFYLAYLDTFGSAHEIRKRIRQAKEDV